MFVMPTVSAQTSGSEPWPSDIVVLVLLILFMVLNAIWLIAFIIVTQRFFYWYDQRKTPEVSS